MCFHRGMLPGLARMDCRTAVGDHEVSCGGRWKRRPLEHYDWVGRRGRWRCQRIPSSIIGSQSARVLKRI
jgi:hypothetical protein